MIAHSDVAFVIDASGHIRSELNFDPGPGTAQPRVIVRGRAGQRGRTSVEPVVKSTWRLATPTARIAGIAGGAVVIAACVLAAGCGSNTLTTPPTTAVPAAPPPLTTASIDATGAGWAIVEMGGSAAQEDNVWELFVRPDGNLAVAAGHPGWGGQQRQPRGGGHRRVAGGRVPAESGPDVLASRGHQRRRGYLVGVRAAHPGPGRRARCAGFRVRRPAHRADRGADG